MITNLERYVLEAFTDDNNDIASLIKRTELNLNAINNCLTSLLTKGHIRIFKNSYELNRGKIKYANNLSYIDEIQELVSTQIEYNIENNNSNTRFKKVSLDHQEKAYLFSKFEEINYFLEKKIKENNFKTSKHSEKILISWSTNTYKEIINHLTEGRAL